jgi:hypothetical protein
MQPIDGKLFSPFEKKRKTLVMKGYDFDYETTVSWEKRDATVSNIRRSPGYDVFKFRQLVNEVAHVTISNKNYEMYYRGQSKDYMNNQSSYFRKNEPKTIIYPSICRPERKEDGTYKYSTKKSQIIKRYDDLSKMIELMTKKGRRKSHFNEYYYSLLQHYDILPTPFIDITQSLRVAATFALKASNSGYLYVFGLPYANQSISYYSDLSIVLIKLQNVMPLDALRPRYQEGYLVGKFPIQPTKEQGDDLANRLVAKFRLNNKDGNFWDKHFLPMPEEILYPENDYVLDKLLSQKRDFDAL